MKKKKKPQNIQYYILLDNHDEVFYPSFFPSSLLH